MYKVTVGPGEFVYCQTHGVFVVGVLGYFPVGSVDVLNLSMLGDFFLGGRPCYHQEFDFIRPERLVKGMIVKVNFFSLSRH